MDPRTRVLLLVFAGVLAVTLERPASLLVFAGGCSLPLLLLRAGGRWRQGAFVAALTLVWGTVLSQGIFYAAQPRTPLVHLGPLVFYREGAVHGLVQSLRLVGVTLAGLAVVLTTPVERLLLALNRLRVPFGVAFLAVTALRFLPEVTEDLATVRRARERRGRPSWRRSPWAWLRLEVAGVRPVVARALRRARVLAETLDTRGFDPAGRRTAWRPLHWGRWERGLLVAVGVMVLATAGLRLLYLLYAVELLYLPRLRPLYAWIRSYL